MGSTGASTERIEALRALVDRLSSPDLTLGEAKVLRCRLLELTGWDEETGSARCMELRAARTSVRCEGQPYGPRTTGCRIFAA